MEVEFSGGAIERVEGALGKPLLQFALNATSDGLTGGQASENQRQVLIELDDLLSTGDLARELESGTMKEVLRGRLTEASDGAAPLAVSTYQQCGGDLDLPDGADEAENAIVELARDTYPAFLLPPEESMLPALEFESFRVSRMLSYHPAAKRLELAVMGDPVFASVFAQENDSSGRYAMIYRSTFRGGGLQLVMLARQILVTTWRDRPSGELMSIHEFAEAAIGHYRFIRAAFEGAPQTVRARLAFAGVRLPTSDRRQFGAITLREATSGDRSLAPESLKQELTGTDQEGNTTVINYDGDVVAETQIPYVVKVTHESMESTSSFPAELIEENPVESLSTRLRISLLLAVTRKDRVQIVPSWQCINDPLDAGRVIAWSDPRQTTNLVPARLTEEETAAWQEWFDLLENPDATKISLAMSRLVRATGERRDPVDVLIDSVIAWENLFGTKEGEPTLRVTASSAVLLEADPAQRRRLRSKLAKIYALRSNAVHGTGLPKRAEIPLCYDALDVGIEAVRVLLKERADVLRESDGGARSLAVLLGR